MSSSFLISRMNNQKIKDSLPSQGMRFLKLGTIIDLPTLQAVNTALTNNDLGFMETGSLYSVSKQNAFWQSPLALSSETPSKSNIIVVEANVTNPNYLAFSNMSAKPITASQFADVLSPLPGTLYVSPFSAHCILQMLSDDTGNLSTINIYYNPLYGIKDNDTIETNLSTYCTLVGNQDPLCFCQNDTDICADGAIGNYLLANSMDRSDYDTLKKNCAYLSPVCNIWASNGNAYAKSQINLGSATTLCNTKFDYNTQQQTPTTSANESISQICKLSEPIDDKIPIIRTEPSPSNNKQTLVIVLCLVFIVVCLSVYWFYF